MTCKFQINILFNLQALDVYLRISDGKTMGLIGRLLLISTAPKNKEKNIFKLVSRSDYFFLIFRLIVFEIICSPYHYFIAKVWHIYLIREEFPLAASTHVSSAKKSSKRMMFIIDVNSKQITRLQHKATLKGWIIWLTLGFLWPIFVFNYIDFITSLLEKF